VTKIAVGNDPVNMQYRDMTKQEEHLYKDIQFWFNKYEKLQKKSNYAGIVILVLTVVSVVELLIIVFK